MPESCILSLKPRFDLNGETKNARTNQRSPITRSAYPIRPPPQWNEVFGTDTVRSGSCRPLLMPWPTDSSSGRGRWERVALTSSSGKAGGPKSDRQPTQCSRGMGRGTASRTFQARITQPDAQWLRRANPGRSRSRADSRSGGAHSAAARASRDLCRRAGATRSSDRTSSTLPQA
jgi:hypothetical protein